MKHFIKKYIGLLIFVQGVIFFLVMNALAPRTWSLNRSIGWGIDSDDRYSFYLVYSYFPIWIILFPVLYWILGRFRRRVNIYWGCFQIVCVAIIVQDLVFVKVPVFYLNIFNYVLFALTLFFSEKENSFPIDEDVLDNEFNT